MQEKTPSRRGGSRAGAGRPKATDPKRTLTIRLSPDLYSFIEQSGMSRSECIEKAIRLLMQSSGS